MQQMSSFGHISVLVFCFFFIGFFNIILCMSPLSAASAWCFSCLFCCLIRSLRFYCLLILFAASPDLVTVSSRNANLGSWGFWMPLIQKCVFELRHYGLVQWLLVGSCSFTILNALPCFMISYSPATTGCLCLISCLFIPLCCRTTSVTPSNLIMSTTVTLTVGTTYKQTLRFNLFMFALPDFLLSSIYCSDSDTQV